MSLVVDNNLLLKSLGEAAAIAVYPNLWPKASLNLNLTNIGNQNFVKLLQVPMGDDNIAHYLSYFEQTSHVPEEQQETIIKIMKQLLNSVRRPGAGRSYRSNALVTKVQELLQSPFQELFSNAPEADEPDDEADEPDDEADDEADDEPEPDDITDLLTLPIQSVIHTHHQFSARFLTKLLV